MSTETSQHSLRESIHAFTYRELAVREWPLREPLISPWLMKGESAMIWAGAGVGKTMLSLSVAALVAGGGSFAGWHSKGGFRVLIVDGEMYGADLVERLNTLTEGIEGIDREVALDNIEVRARQLQEPGTEFYDIGDKGTQRELMDLIMQRKIDLLILDNVTTLTDTMGDENSVEAIKPVLRFLMDLKQTGVSVILVHHANKSGGSYRGSTAISTTFEVIMGLVRPEDAPMGETAFKLKFDKYRAKATEALVPKIFTLSGPTWQVEEDEGDLALRLVRAIRSGRFTTQQDAGFYVDITDKTKVSRVLSRAYGEGLIKKEEVKTIFRAAKEAMESVFEENPL